MPETARILRFPNRSGGPLGPKEVLERADAYLHVPAGQRTPESREAVLAQPDVLLSVCTSLRERIEGNASDVCEEAVALYRSITASERPIGAFDEEDYFLGETALLAGTASRLLGKRSEAELWFDRAEAGFRHTVNPAPLLANVTYQRLALRCEMGRYDEVAELAPMLGLSFARLNMLPEEAKCIFLQGTALKQSGNHEPAMNCFESLNRTAVADRDPGLTGLALVSLADIHAADGQDNLAIASYAKALPLLEKARKPAAIAHLKGVIGETLRRQGRLEASVEAYGAAISDYEALQMTTWVAYLRVVLAQTLLETGRAREAEWQILAALPTIDEQKMVPEGFAAVALLRESIRLRKMDPGALLELRERLGAKN